MGAWLPYRRARRVLEEFFPLGDDPPMVETIRQRTLHVGARLEREAVAAPRCATDGVAIDRPFHRRWSRAIGAQLPSAFL